MLALSAGALYGPVDGTIVAAIGYNCGGLAGFLAGRYLVRDCVIDRIRAHRKALIALQVGSTFPEQDRTSCVESLADDVIVGIYDDCR